MKQTRISQGSHEMVSVLTSTLIFYAFARISGKPASHILAVSSYNTTHSIYNSVHLFTTRFMLAFMLPELHLPQPIKKEPSVEKMRVSGWF